MEIICREWRRRMKAEQRTGGIYAIRQRRGAVPGTLGENRDLQLLRFSFRQNIIKLDLNSRLCRVVRYTRRYDTNCN